MCVCFLKELNEQVHGNFDEISFIHQLFVFVTKVPIGKKNAKFASHSVNWLRRSLLLLRAIVLANSFSEKYYLDQNWIFVGGTATEKKAITLYIESWIYRSTCSCCLCVCCVSFSRQTEKLHFKVWSEEQTAVITFLEYKNSESSRTKWNIATQTQ